MKFMRYEDLLPGDKIKFREEYLKFVTFKDDKELIKNKKLTIEEINVNRNGDVINFRFKKIGNWNYLIRNINYIEIVELVEER